ncbi:MAG: DUF3786 domain-containing protein [Candidatus Omnitrophica bacterium]|nr:DUF3786 domain-containing protein [Candidatus Omnitrophota bacterium]
MGYAVALDKSWKELEALKAGDSFLVKFLADEYSIDCKAKTVFSLSCNARAKDFTAILILHYLASKIKGLPPETKEWVSFKELSSGEQYYPAFRKRAIEPIIRKYGRNSEGADIILPLSVFEGVPVLVKFWRGDDEFGPEANMLFDKSIAKIFCTEDVAVLGGLVAAGL